MHLMNAYLRTVMLTKGLPPLYLWAELKMETIKEVEGSTPS